jgi:glycerol-3-phosphate dehydrogenase (NAD(P)+)
MTVKVTVLGAGAWGTALANVLAERGEGPVVLWSRRQELSDAINANHENARYLPAVRLSNGLSATHDLDAALVGAGMIVFAVPSHAMRLVARATAPQVDRDIPVVSATKGIETGSLMFMDEVLTQELPSHAHTWLAYLSGPSFAKELALHLPTAVVIAAAHAEVGAQVIKRFHRPYLRVYASDDVAGVECGGALKNVIAIAAGAIDGLGFGHNTRAALITRGLAEVARLAMARGGSALTLAGLAGMGDLVLTCTGELSRNRTVGYEMGRGRSLADVLAGLGHVAEGVRTAQSAYELSKRLGVEMPITSEVYSVLFEDKPVAQAVRDLMARELGYEFDPQAIARTKH